MAEKQESCDLNLIEEFWLRRWARLHYTDPEGRIPNWHPVIHDEMRKKDSERSRVAGRTHVSSTGSPPS